jgi:hypothetical protein
VICSLKPILGENLFVAQKEEVSVTCYMCETYTDEKPSISIRDKPTFSSEGMLYKDYYRKSSVGKKSLVVSLKGPGVKTN